MEKQSGAAEAIETGVAMGEESRLRREVERLAEQNRSLMKTIGEIRQDCRAIWPFVRNWGLCGASPQAVDAALRIGLHAGEGHSDDASLLRAAVELSQNARVDAIREVADKLESSLRGKMLAKDIPTIVDGVRQLADSA
jgi:hypothetical protein